jgi:hypothetical protein
VQKFLYRNNRGGMFSSLFDKKSDKSSEEDKNHSELVTKISKMNLTDMKNYVRGKIPDFKLSRDGLKEVMRRLVKEDAHTSKRYLQSDDMESKIKKAFELVLTISTSNKMSVETIELIQEFILVYKDIIVKYDRDNKQIYGTRLTESIDKSIMIVSRMSDYSLRSKIIGE